MHYVVASNKPNSYEIMLELMKDWNYRHLDEPSNEKDQFLMVSIRSEELNETDATESVKKLIAAGVPIDGKYVK